MDHPIFKAFYETSYTTSRLPFQDQLAALGEEAVPVLLAFLDGDLRHSDGVAYNTCSNCWNSAVHAAVRLDRHQIQRLERLFIEAMRWDGSAVRAFTLMPELSEVAKKRLIDIFVASSYPLLAELRRTLRRHPQAVPDAERLSSGTIYELPYVLVKLRMDTDPRIVEAVEASPMKQRIMDRARAWVAGQGTS